MKGMKALTQVIKVVQYFNLNAPQNFPLQMVQNSHCEING